MPSRIPGAAEATGPRIGAVRVSVVIPAFRAAATIGQTLTALAAQDLSEDFEVIVSLDGPDDGTAAVAASHERVDTVVPALEGSRGAGAARNRGAARARGSVLAFTDADCMPLPDWLSRGMACLDGADLVQGAVRMLPGSAPGPFDRSVVVDRESGWFETANLLLRRELFERLGGFEDWLPLQSRGGEPGRPMGEDVWLGWRARRAGARVSFCPECVVHHAVIRRSAVEYVAENARRVHFPALARRIPELRRHTFFARCFLDRRTASFDAALLGLMLGAVCRRGWPLAAALPYAATVSRRASRGHPRSAKVVLADVAADFLSFGSLAAGSARARTLLI
jgi:glycosyltransferase involved in cell wall biosynthesis